MPKTIENPNTVSITINIRRSLKARADALRERKGDLTRMIEEGLEIVLDKHESRKPTADTQN